MVVFLSSCDGVEFHHRLLTGPALQGLGSDLDDESPLLDCPVWKLHGSMLQVSQLCLLGTPCYVCQSAHQ